MQGLKESLSDRDVSYGEGGGQVARTSFVLSPVLRKPIPIHYIRSLLRLASSAYAGNHGLGRGGMRGSGWEFLNISLLCFGGFRCRADGPTKPWGLRFDLLQRPLA